MLNSDVAIVGGGPAGLATAIEFALRGFEVRVIEPQGRIIDKPCGEGLMPEGVAHLRRLKVFEHLDPHEMSFINGIGFINEKNKCALSPFANGPGLGCRRLNLSKALYARAAMFKNLRIMRAKALTVHQSDQAMLITTDQGVIATRLVIGADGLRSHVRRWAKLEGKPAQVQRYGLRQHFKIRPFSEHVLVYFRPGIEAYVTPCGPEQTNVAFLWTKGSLALAKFSFENLLALFPDLAARLTLKESLSKERAVGPLEQNSLSPIAHGIALVGDASGYLDAITGEGNSIAFASAQALAVICEQAFKKSYAVLGHKELRPYAKAHCSILKSYYRNSRMLRWLAAQPRLMSALIDVGAYYPRLFSQTIEVMRTSGKNTRIKIA